MIILKTKIQFSIFFSEKNAQKNRMQQLELRPLNKTDQLVAMENLHLSLSKSSIKNILNLSFSHKNNLKYVENQIFVIIAA